MDTLHEKQWRFSWNLSIFLKPVEKIQLLLKFYKNNGYFIWKAKKISLNLSIFRKPVEKIQLLLKFYKNNGYFTWKTMKIFMKFEYFSKTCWENSTFIKILQK